MFKETPEGTTHHNLDSCIKCEECGNHSILKNIGALRQWLNEDRITDPKKMVTNEQIMNWLNI